MSTEVVSVERRGESFTRASLVRFVVQPCVGVWSSLVRILLLALARSDLLIAAGIESILKMKTLGLGGLRSTGAFTMWVGGTAFFSLLGCEPKVETSAVIVDAPAQPKAGWVRLASQEVPDGAREIGVVQARSNQTSITKIMPAFVEKVAALGGNYAKVDQISTRYELQTVTNTESYSCGSSTAPHTCTRTVTRTVEVPTTSVLGRAFEVK